MWLNCFFEYNKFEVFIEINEEIIVFNIMGWFVEEYGIMEYLIWVIMGGVE